MNKEVKDINKKEDKKQFRRFWLILLAAGIAGAVIGSFMLKLHYEDKTSIIKEIAGIINDTSIWCNWVLAVLVIISTFVLYKSATKLYKTIKDDEDDIYSKINYKLNLVVTITDVSQSVGMVAMFICLADIILPLGGIQYESNGIWKDTAFVASGWIIATVCNIVSQKIVYDFIKEMNPEKRGSVYDVRFQTKWLESCDEAEKVREYESGYTAYRVNQIICPAFVLISYLGMLFLGWDMSAIVIVGIIWCVSKTSYCVKNIQLERTRK